jgi:hypothetical protein
MRGWAASLDGVALCQQASTVVPSMQLKGGNGLNTLQVALPGQLA